MAAPPRLPPKKDVALALLEQSTIFVHLDPRSEDVRVPPWFKNQPQLVLQVGLNMAVPIPDLDVNDDGISCTLSFSRTPHYCRVPWRAIFALVGENGRGMVWPDDVPREVAAQAAQQQRKEAAPKLHAVPAEAAGSPEKLKKKRVRKPKKEGAAERPKPRAAESNLKAPQPQPERLPARQAEATSNAEPTGGEAKRRRDLPPYLRVIK